MFERISEHIYVRPCEYYTDRPNIGLVCGKDRALLFDAGNSAANVRQLKKELEAASLPCPELVALSHWHWDHSFGARFWAVPVIAGRETDRQLRIVQGWSWDDAAMEKRLETGEDIRFCHEMIKREYPDRSLISVCAADIVFDGRLSVDLGGGISCELIHVRGPHSMDSVICHVPSDRFVFLGDSNGKDLYGQPWHFDIEHEEELVPTISALPFDPARLIPYRELLSTLDFDACIGGHSGAMSRQELFDSLSL